MILTASNSHISRVQDRIGFVLLLSLLAWSLVPFGSNRPWAEALNGALGFGLLAVVLIERIWSQSTELIIVTIKQPVMYWFSIWILLVVGQMVLLPMQWVLWISPNSYAIQELAHHSLQWIPISLDRDATLLVTFRIGTVAALVFLLFQFLTNRRRLLIFALTLIVCGLFEAIIGLGVYWSGSADMAANIAGQETIGPVGTFISRNHYAGFLEMAIAMNMGLIIMHYKPDFSGSGWRARVRDLSGQLLSMHGLLLTIQIVMFSALLLSGSRGGVLVLIIAITLVVAGLALRQGQDVLRSLLPIAVAAGAAILWFGAGSLISRLGTLGLSSNRLDLAQVSLRMIADYPLTGSGAGTFRWIFPLYKDARFGSLFYEHAHNDYLEIAAEQGVFGLLIFLVITGLFLYHAYRAYCDRHDSLARGVSLGAMIAGISILGHSMIDFNLQIPANFYWFFAILTAGACARQVGRRSAR